MMFFAWLTPNHILLEPMVIYYTYINTDIINDILKLKKLQIMLNNEQQLGNLADSFSWCICIA